MCASCTPTTPTYIFSVPNTHSYFIRISLARVELLLRVVGLTLRVCLHSRVRFWVCMHALVSVWWISLFNIANPMCTINIDVMERLPIFFSFRFIFIFQIRTCIFEIRYFVVVFCNAFNCGAFCRRSFKRISTGLWL